MEGKSKKAKLLEKEDWQALSNLKATMHFHYQQGQQGYATPLTVALHWKKQQRGALPQVLQEGYYYYYYYLLLLPLLLLYYSIRHESLDCVAPSHF